MKLRDLFGWGRPRGNPAGGRLSFGSTRKRVWDMFLEIDEEVDASLPSPIVDDDNDVLTDFIVDWSSSSPDLTVLPNADNLGAIVRATGVVAQATVTARVSVQGGGFGDYIAEIIVGMGVPVGGALGFGTPRKITP